jgi:hypothetical protein
MAIMKELNCTTAGAIDTRGSLRRWTILGRHQ